MQKSTYVYLTHNVFNIIIFHTHILRASKSYTVCCIHKENFKNRTFRTYIRKSKLKVLLQLTEVFELTVIGLPGTYRSFR